MLSIGVNIDFFCDNNENKQGDKWENILCISIDELEEIKYETTVLVAIYDCDEVVGNLEKRGFDSAHIYSNELFSRFPLGHYYSPYPNIDEILKRREKIFCSNKANLDIEFNENNQIRLLEQMVVLYDSVPKWRHMDEKENSPFRYRLGNDYFSFADTIALHCMLRIYKPHHLIEVGSGYSSAVTLDTNEFYLDNSINLTFIEPFPDRLKLILKESDSIELIQSGLQDIPLETFDRLEENDILFIDSTHVSKINSDVNYLFFEIFPRLKSGVIIHLHDIFYPFEYPKEWIQNGIFWNELYLLRAFLQNNNVYEILFFQNMMQQKYMSMFEKQWNFPEVIYGGSMWMRKK